MGRILLAPHNVIAREREDEMEDGRGAVCLSPSPYISHRQKAPTSAHIGEGTKKGFFAQMEEAYAGSV